MSRKSFQKLVTIVSIISLFGSSAYGAIAAINNAIKPTENTNAASSIESQLQVQERGYKLVLQREPENQVALKGLVEVRLRMKNALGAVEPLEKLVKLNPTQQEYKVLLAQVKKQVGKAIAKKFPPSLLNFLIITRLPKEINQSSMLESNSQNVQVSVVIPCYNQGQYIDEAVESVLAQSYQDFEIIIVNDGSNNADTIKILETYSKPKTRVIHTNNQGASIARNNGIKVSSGRYILPLDADDRIGSVYIEKAIEVLDKNENVGIVYCEAEFFGNALDYCGISSNVVPSPGSRG
jgi:hypothetical protein